MELPQDFIKNIIKTFKDKINNKKSIKITNKKFKII